MRNWISFFVLFFALNSMANEKFEIPSGVVSLAHSRADLELEQVSMLISCFDKNGSWQTCTEIRVDGKSIENSLISLPAISQNQVKVPEITVSMDDGSEEFFCVGMKAHFKGFPNVCDSVLYPPYPDRRALDRYSVLSYCSNAKIDEGSGAGARFSSRRVVSWRDYLYFLTKPIPMTLTDASEDQCLRPDTNN